MSTDNSYQTYLKDCDCENGGIILHEGEAVCRWCRKPYGKGGKMYYEPNHFKASKQPKQERIEVMISGDGTAGQYTFILPFKREHFIHPDKFPAIKQAIESVLNNDTVVEDEYTVKVTKQHWEELHALLDGYEKGMDKIVQDKVYACMESIWNEARATNPMAGMKYDTFQDFKNIWVEPTNDNAFVEDQLTAFVNSLRGVKWDNDFFVHFVWGITPVVGRITLLPYTKQLQIMPCKNTDDIGSGNGQSVIINFPRNDLKQSKQSAPEPSALPTKEWEIVDMKHYEDNSIHPYLKKTCFNPSHPPCTIWSVRRLSDNVVFSVGDSICLSWYPAFDVVQPIKKINIDGGKVYLYYNDSSCYELHNARLNPKHTPPQPSTVKDKEALFTTEDGVKIYDYSKSLFAIVKKDKSFYIHENFIGANPSEHYYFSTKEAAEQYIIENKPCLSVLELFSCYDGTHYKQPILRDSSLYIKLIEKVKQKLKQ